MNTPNVQIEAVSQVERSIELRKKDRSSLTQLDGREGILWLCATLLMLTIGILKGINLVIVLGYILLGLWMLNFYLAPKSIYGLKVKRLPRSPIVAGIPLEWSVEVSDDGKGTGNWVLEERINEDSAGWMMIRTSEPSSLRHRFRVIIQNRGKYRIEPMRARSGYPFGLYNARIDLLPAEDLLVLPKPARVDGDRLREWLLHSWAGRDEERRKLRRVVEREAEIHGLRDYRPGDLPRRIHWKATARRGRLVVREYEDSIPPRMLLIVDPWVPHEPIVDDRERLELLMSLAAGVCREWRREPGARLTLAMCGPEPILLEGAPGPGLTERMLEAFAIEKGGATTSVVPLLNSMRRLSLDAPVLVLSTRPDTPTSHEVLRTLGRSAAVAIAGKPETWYRME